MPRLWRRARHQRHAENHAEGRIHLRALLRGGASDDEIEGELRRVWSGRADRYSDLRSAATKDLPKVEMSYIGG